MVCSDQSPTLFEKAIVVRKLARWSCVEKVNHSRDSWLVLRSLAYKPAFHVCNAILESFFYANR